MTIHKHPRASSARQHYRANGYQHLCPPLLRLGPNLIIECGHRSASATRKIAVALERNPIPAHTMSELEARWQVGPDTVRKVLRAFGIYSGGQKGALIPLTDILLCEGVLEPLAMWIGATSREREILASGLLTLAQWQAHFPADKSKHATTHYRRLKHTSLSIRIGNQHRFRPGLDMPCSPRSRHGEGRP